MIYPQTVTLTYIHKMVFITDKKVQFVATGNSNETPYKYILKINNTFCSKPIQNII